MVLETCAGSPADIFNCEQASPLQAGFDALFASPHTVRHYHLGQQLAAQATCISYGIVSSVAKLRHKSLGSDGLTASVLCVQVQLYLPDGNHPAHNLLRGVVKDSTDFYNSNLDAVWLDSGESVAGSVTGM